MFGGKKGETFDENNTLPTVKHGADLLCFSGGCVTAIGTGNFACVNGRIDSSTKNNDSKHTSKSTLKCFKKVGFVMALTVLWLIENLWVDLKHAVHARQPKNIAELDIF